MMNSQHQSSRQQSPLGTPLKSSLRSPKRSPSPHQQEFIKVAELSADSEMIARLEQSAPLRTIQRDNNTSQTKQRQQSPFTLNVTPQQLSPSTIKQSQSPDNNMHQPEQSNFQAFSHDEDPHQIEPIVCSHAPQMMQMNLIKPDTFPFQSADSEPVIPSYYNLKRVQENVFNIYSNFPLIQDTDLIDKNYMKIIDTAMTQVDFLFEKIQRQGANQEEQLFESQNNFSKLMVENQQATQNVQMLKTSLEKADNIVKNLRIENEYFQRQLESLRKEVEQVKQQSSIVAESTTNLQNSSLLPPIPNTRARSHDRNSISKKENGNVFFGQEDHRNSVRQSLGGGYEPPQSQLNMPQPMPMPRAPQLHEFSDDQHLVSYNKDHLITSPLNGQQHLMERQHQPVRGSSFNRAQPRRVQTSTSANARRPLQKLNHHDENNFIGNIHDMPLQQKDPNLEAEVRSLRFELQQQSEVLLLKTETIRTTQDQLDQQKRRMTNDAQKAQSELVQEIETLRRELELCKSNEVTKEHALLETKRQCQDLFKSRTIEMNLLINKPQANCGQEKENWQEQTGVRTGKSANRQNKASKNLKFAMDLNKEMELMFADDDLQIGKHSKNQKKKQRKDNNGNKLQKQSSQVSSTAGPSLLRSNCLLQNQIQAAIMAESLIDEIKEMEHSQTNEVSDLLGSCQSLTVHAQTMDQENKKLNERVLELSSTNDDLKRKFSTLLDQFQEYVSVQEQKLALDQEKQKQTQQTLLQNMQDNIKELEKVTESLQAELQNKERVFEVLKKDNKELEEKLDAKTKDEALASHQAMRRMEDELSFLKKHHELEINMLKEQYDRSLDIAKSIAQETVKINNQQQQQTQHTQLQQEYAHANQSIADNCSASMRLSDHQPYQQPPQRQMTPISETQQHQSQPPQSQHNKNNANYHIYSPGQEPLSSFYGARQYPPLHPVSPHLERSADFGQKEEQQPVGISQQAYDHLQKELQEKTHLLEEKNREILHFRMLNDDSAQIQSYNQRAGIQTQQMHQPQGSFVSSDQRGQLINDLTQNITILRSELARVKSNMFSQIGRQINYDAQDPNHMREQARQIGREEDLHGEILIQVSEVRALITVAQEIGMLSQSSLTGKPAHPRATSGSPTRNKVAAAAALVKNSMGKTSHDANYQVKRSADQMLRQNHCSGLHDLLLEQLTISETLMNDNSLMQRQLYKYDTTLAELDMILRGDKKDQSIFELKKLVEQQLKQIIILQKDIELARQGLPASGAEDTLSQIGTNQIQALIQNDPSIQKELETLKFQQQEQKMANEELISERRNLMELIENLESQSKDSHRNMEKALNKVQMLERDIDDKNNELEDIRQRVTKVAELFERKGIKQKYSFEVLCDFIHDKAQRLFTKYDNLSKETKVMKEEKNFYFQRRLDQLEQENFTMKETNRAAERIIHEIVPNLGQLLERPMIQSRELSEYYYARQVLEQLEIEHRTLKKSHQILVERNNDLGNQIHAIKQGGEQYPHAQSTIENCAPNNQHQAQQNFRTSGINSADSLYNQPAGTTQHPTTSYRSPYNQILSDAKASEPCQRDAQQTVSGQGIINQRTVVSAQESAASPIGRRSNSPFLNAENYGRNAAEQQKYSPPVIQSRQQEQYPPNKVGAHLQSSTNTNK